MSERVSFLLPDLGEGLQEATVTEWRVSPGESITLNQTLCVLETAKAEIEVPSPHAGRVAQLRAETGETVQVGAPLVIIEIDHTPAECGPVATKAGAPSAVLVGYGASPPPPAAPSRRWRRRSIRETGLASVPRTAVGSGTPVRSLAKPPVRALARDMGVDIEGLAPGSGPDGIITRDDVLAASSSAPIRAIAGTSFDLVTPGEGVIPVRGVRAAIAERMSVSRREIPEASCGLWVDCSHLIRISKQVRSTPEAAPVTPFALILRFTVISLLAAPILNSRFHPDEMVIRLADRVNLGFGVATQRGLVVAVIRDADRHSTLSLASEVARLTTAARNGTAHPDELSGSTFTVSNFGALGLDDGNPVINHPDAAILGVGAIAPRPCVVDGALAVRSTAKLTCAFDHRICDGADAAAFLKKLKQLVESPDPAFDLPTYRGEQVGAP